MNQIIKAKEKSKEMHIYKFTTIKIK